MQAKDGVRGNCVDLVSLLVIEDVHDSSFTQHFAERRAAQRTAISLYHGQRSLLGHGRLSEAIWHDVI